MRSIRLDELGLEALSVRGLAIALLAHIAIWTVVASVAQSSGGLHHDMTEAWDWGREFQFGYSKHPPVFPWLAGAWFLVFPRTDWAFYLLSATSAAAGLLGVWCLAGRLLPGRERTMALLLLVLAPFFSIMAVNFNGNSILLLTWPWTIYAFVRCIQSQSLLDGILFGAMAGLALDSKYTSILLLASCLAAALVHPRMKTLFAGPAPYAAILTALVVVAPHLLWAVDHKFAPVTYIAQKPQISAEHLLMKSVSSIFGSLALCFVPILAGVTVLASTRQPDVWRRTLETAVAPEWRWLTLLTFGPFLLTYAAGLATSIKVSTNYLLPTLLLLPVTFVLYSGWRVSPGQLRKMWMFVVGWLVLALVAAPAISVIAFVQRADHTVEPRREVAVEATRAWHEAFGSALKIAGGSEAYGLGLPFYSPDAPRYYAFEAPENTPWVTKADITREGLLLVCDKLDLACLRSAEGLAGPASLRKTVHIRRNFFTLRSLDFEFELFMLPPAS